MLLSIYPDFILGAIGFCKIFSIYLYSVPLFLGVLCLHTPVVSLFQCEKKSYTVTVWWYKPCNILRCFLKSIMFMEVKSRSFSCYLPSWDQWVTIHPGWLVSKSCLIISGVDKENNKLALRVTISIKWLQPSQPVSSRVLAPS